MADDLYAVLGVARDASEAEIRRAYRKLASENHPDAGGDHEVMAKLNVAKEILLDPARRRRYDSGQEDLPQASLEAIAAGNIAGLLASLLDHEGIDEKTTDIIEVMTERMRKGQEKNREKIQKMEIEIAVGIPEKIAKTEGMLKRLKLKERKRDLPDFLLEILRARRRQQEEAIAHLQQKIKDATEMNELIEVGIEMVSQYGYHTDPKPKGQGTYRNPFFSINIGR